MRHTFLITSLLARHTAMLEAARQRAHGRQLMSPAQVAARLAGGFLQLVDRESLQAALDAIIADAATDFGDMQAIRDLPGMRRALAATLERAWSAGIDLQARAAASPEPRNAAMARIERAVLARLPAAMLRHPDLVTRALERVHHAPRVLGLITVRGVPDLDPVWRTLIAALAKHVPVTWRLHHDRAPEWLDGTGITVHAVERQRPALARVSCANPRHEALEALRWARELIASGRAKPQDIAIAAPATSEWDAHFAAMIDDANLPVAFVHGRPALDTRDGQAAAALAEVLLGGLSQHRVRRLVALVRGMTPATEHIPREWASVLPRDAPLLTLARWQAALAAVSEWPEGQDFAAPLGAILTLLARGHAAAAAAGELLLAGRALAIWRKALREGPPQAVDVTLKSVRVDDAADATTSVAWCSAADIATCARPFVRLLGLTSRGWPRTQSEDPLLPAHVIPSAELNPVPVAERDRRDFRTVLVAAATEVVLSRSRRDAEGRQTGASAMLREAGEIAERYLRRERIPEHAASEADRLLARPEEFATTPLAVSARACWVDWHTPRLTGHDGMVRAGHPAIRRVLGQRFSATRLRKLARDPLGFVWRYVLGWDAPAEQDEPLALDALEFGNLAHRVLELALADLEANGGFARADAARIGAAIAQAVTVAAAEHEAAQPIPPRLIWRRTLDEAQACALTALTWQEQPLPGQVSIAEVPFGGSARGDRAAPHALPWNPDTPVVIPGAELPIGGFIDRLDLSADRRLARVTDYKTGKPPKQAPEVSGGAELQRCLYAYAVQALIGPEVAVEARLLYPRDGGGLLALAEPAATAARVAEYLRHARDHVLEGHALIGPDSAGRNDDPLTFALPGNAKDIYIERKLPLAAERLRPLPELWELP
jgi:RecB family exonuclease